MITLAVIVIAAGAALYVAYRVRESHDFNSRMLVATIVFLLIAGVTRGVVLRPMLAERARMKVPIYRALKTSEPVLYESIKSDLGDSGSTNMTALSLRVRENTATLLAKYGPRASDDAVRHFIAASLKSMEAVAAIRGDAPATNIDPAPLQAKLTEGVVQNQLAALAEVISSGSEGRPVADDSGRAEQLLQLASYKVVSYSGSEARMDGFRYTMALYREVLSLPTEDSGLVIRHMLANADQTH